MIPYIIPMNSCLSSHHPYERGCVVWSTGTQTANFYFPLTSLYAVSFSFTRFHSHACAFTLLHPLHLGAVTMKKCRPMPRGGGTLGISGWGCAARTLEPLAYTRASFSCILLPYTRSYTVFLSLDKIFNQPVSFVKNDSLF